MNKIKKAMIEEDKKKKEELKIKYKNDLTMWEDAHQKEVQDFLHR